MYKAIFYSFYSSVYRTDIIRLRVAILLKVKTPVGLVAVSIITQYLQFGSDSGAFRGIPCLSFLGSSPLVCRPHSLISIRADCRGEF
jgi:hypothetical protein